MLAVEHTASCRRACLHLIEATNFEQAGAMQVAPAAAGTDGAKPRAGRQPGATLANGAPATGKGWDCEVGWAEGGRGALRERARGPCAPAAADTDTAESRAGRQPGVTLANGAPATGKGWDSEMGWAEGGWGARRGRAASHDKGHGRAPPGEWAWAGARWHDIGFVAAFVQMLGASLFQLSVVAGAPDLIPPTDWQLLDALLWTPQARRQSDMASMRVSWKSLGDRAARKRLYFAYHAGHAGYGCTCTGNER